MKKIVLLAIALIMALSLVACGGDNNTPANNEGNNPPVEENNPTNNPPVVPQGGNNATLTTLEGWLSHWSLTEDDLKPANFTRLDKTAFSLEDGTIKDVGAYVDKALTDEEARAWVEKVISKLKSISDDGKITNIAENEDELTTDFIMGLDTPRIAGGILTYKGKSVSVSIVVTPRALDDADPDEAMPACSLGLQY